MVSTEIENEIKMAAVVWAEGLQLGNTSRMKYYAYAALCGIAWYGEMPRRGQELSVSSLIDLTVRPTEKKYIKPPRGHVSHIRMPNNWETAWDLNVAVQQKRLENKARR